MTLKEDEPDIPVQPTATATAEPIEVATTPAPRTCNIVAPQTLPEGYTFPAQVDGIDFIVTVPPGGITEGQQFQVPYPTATENKAIATSTPGTTTVTTAVATPGGGGKGTDAPTGRWRTGLCDCCEVIGNGMFWQGWCCNPILLGQVMTRMKLNPIGMPGDYSNTFVVLFAVWVLYLILSFVGVGDWIVYPFVIYMLIAFTCTRFHYRKKYDIPPSTCDCFDGKCDDCICGWCCPCCVSIQMARHTHDEKVHHYQCCAKTGLMEGAPEIV